MRPMPPAPGGACARPGGAGQGDLRQGHCARRLVLAGRGVHSMSVAGAHGADPQRLQTCTDAGEMKLRVEQRGGWQRFRQGDVWRKQGRARHDAGRKTLHGWRAGLARGAALGCRTRIMPTSRDCRSPKSQRQHWRRRKKAAEAGVQVSMHAIGDEGNRLAPNWMEAASRGDAWIPGPTGAGASSTRRSCTSRTFHASRRWGSFRRCSRAMRSAISIPHRRVLVRSGWRGVCMAGADRCRVDDRWRI